MFRFYLSATLIVYSYLFFLSPSPLLKTPFLDYIALVVVQKEGRNSSSGEPLETRILQRRSGFIFDRLRACNRMMRNEATDDRLFHPSFFRRPSLLPINFFFYILFSNVLCVICHSVSHSLLSYEFLKFYDIVRFYCRIVAAKFSENSRNF